MSSFTSPYYQSRRSGGGQGQGMQLLINLLAKNNAPQAAGSLAADPTIVEGQEFWPAPQTMYKAQPDNFWTKLAGRGGQAEREAQALNMAGQQQQAEFQQQLQRLLAETRLNRGNTALNQQYSVGVTPADIFNPETSADVFRKRFGEGQADAYAAQLGADAATAKARQATDTTKALSATSTRDYDLNNADLKAAIENAALEQQRKLVPQSNALMEALASNELEGAKLAGNDLQTRAKVQPTASNTALLQALLANREANWMNLNPELNEQAMQAEMLGRIEAARNKNLVSVAPNTKLGRLGAGGWTNVAEGIDTTKQPMAFPPIDPKTGKLIPAGLTATGRPQVPQTTTAPSGEGMRFDPSTRRMRKTVKLDDGSWVFVD